MVIAMSEDNEFLMKLIKGRIIDCGELSISKTTLGKEKGPRYLIYLPTNRNYLWKLLKEKKGKLRVYIELPEEIKT